MTRRLRTILALSVGVALLGGLVWWVGPAEVGRAFAEADPAFLALGVLAYAVFFLVRGVRWRMLYPRNGPSVRLSTTTGATAIGWFANSILPLRGGEVLRAAVVSKRDQVGLVTSVTTVALERVLDLLALAIVAALGLFLLPSATTIPPWMVTALEIVWVLPILCIAVLVGLVAFRERFVAFLDWRLARLGKFGRKLVGFVDTVLLATAALFAQPRMLAKVLPLTLIIAVAQSLVFTFFVQAFIPQASWQLAFAGSSIFLLSFVISFAPGNVGTYEAAFAAVFVALGIPADVAVPAAILTHLTTTLVVAVAGSVALLALGVKSSRIDLSLARPAPQGGPP